MKIYKYILPLLIISFLISCSDSDDNPDDPINEIEGEIKVQEISNDDHIIEIYTETGKLQQGYNEITIRIKNKSDGSFVKNVSMKWNPVMHMETKKHSGPKSAIVKEKDKETLYEGYLIFQMAENDTEKWELTFTYTIGGENYEASDFISVPATEKRVVTTFMGTDQERYVLALVEPDEPEVKINDIEMALYKMENMMTFSMVKDHTIKLDPRMPSMGNHSSPNNEDLTYDAEDNLYKGKLSLTMTGYWKLNLMVLNSADEVLKGEVITEENESSSLFLELEF